jgi:protein arginine kinase
MNSPQKNNLPLLDNRTRWFSKPGSLSDSVISTRIRLSRNISGFRFPSSMKESERKDLFGKLSVFFLNQPPFNYDGACYSMNRLSSDERNLLWERNIIPHRLVQEQKGQVLLSLDESLNVALCLDDHIQYIGLESGLSLNSLFERISRLKESTQSSFAFSQGEGGDYLTSRVTEAGSGLRASVLMQLPSLSLLEDMEPLFLALMDRGLSIRGFLDDEDFSRGGLYQIYNTGGAGFINDLELLNSLSEAVKILSEREENCRETIREGHYPQVEDRIYRSLGILRYCRILSSQEALKHLVLLRQGICLGWISEISLEAISALMLFTGHAHMTRIIAEEGREPTEEACSERRARLVREVLSGGLTYFGV